MLDNVEAHFTAASMVSLPALATQLGIDKSHALRWARVICPELGIPMVKGRAPETGRQLTYLWSQEDAERLREERRRLGFAVNGKASLPAMQPTAAGAFYVLQAIPELAPQRIKVGFATDLARRIADHRCTLPTAKLLAAWPCEAADERCILRCVMNAPSVNQIGVEVFDGDPGEILARLDRMFALLGGKRLAGEIEP